MEPMDLFDVHDNDLVNTKISKFNKFGGGDESIRDDSDEDYDDDGDVVKQPDAGSENEDSGSVANSDADSDISNEDDDEDEGEIEKPAKKNVKFPEVTHHVELSESEDSDDSDSDSDSDYLKKFDKELRKNYIADSHPEVLTYNYSEIQALATVIRDADTGIIIDEFHKTIPILTKYEKTRIIGQRTKQLNSGAKPYIKVNPKQEMDGYTIALQELSEKLLPFIIRRPLPNGASEFWKLNDLQILYN